MSSLNPTQRHVIKEIKAPNDLFQLDGETIGSGSNSKWRTAHLKAARNQIVRGHVVMRRALVDDFLTTVVAHFFFGKKKSFLNAMEDKAIHNLQLSWPRRFDEDMQRIIVHFLPAAPHAR
jgi:hypothetical protein